MGRKKSEVPAKGKKGKSVGKKMQSSFDPEGSWTGNYLLGLYEDPVQDVDDL